MGDYAESMNKASCLGLVSNAVLYWNTAKMEEIIKTLEREGEHIDKHVIPMGTYFVESH